MNFDLFLWTLCILLIHFNFMLPMNFEPNENDAGLSRHAKRPRRGSNNAGEADDN
jgi:hypothetical protein